VSAHLAGDDQLVDLNGSVSVERREPGSHLVDEHAERPPVDRLVVALAHTHRATPPAISHRSTTAAWFRRDIGHTQIAIADVITSESETNFWRSVNECQLRRRPSFPFTTDKLIYR